jgi:hypothetical protein
VAVTPPTLTAAIIAAAPTLKGPAWFQLCSGIGTGIVVWAVIPSNVVVTGVVTGTTGGGAVGGKLVIPPVPAPIVASVSGAGLVGATAPQIATAVGIGIGNAYSATGQYVGTSTGAIGSDVSKVVFANPATLTPLLVSSLAAQGIRGPAAIQLCGGLAPGIASMFLTGTGIGVAAGPSGPAPGIGVSKSSVL